MTSTKRVGEKLKKFHLIQKCALFSSLVEGLGGIFNKFFSAVEKE